MYVSFNTRENRCSGLPWLLLDSLNTTCRNVCIYMQIHVCILSLHETTVGMGYQFYCRASMYVSFNMWHHRWNWWPVLLQGFRHTTRMNVYTYRITCICLSICETIVGLDDQCYCWASNILHEWMCTRTWLHVRIFQHMRPSLERAASAAAGLPTYYTNKLNVYTLTNMCIYDLV